MLSYLVAIEPLWVLTGSSRARVSKSFCSLPIYSMFAILLNTTMSLIGISLMSSKTFGLPISFDYTGLRIYGSFWCYTIGILTTDICSLKNVVGDNLVLMYLWAGDNSDFLSNIDLSKLSFKDPWRGSSLEYSFLILYQGNLCLVYLISEFKGTTSTWLLWKLTRLLSFPCLGIYFLSFIGWLSIVEYFLDC